VAVLCLTALSAAVHAVAVQGSHDIPTDTSGFLRVVALMQDRAGLVKAPRRMTNPLYPILILGFDAFTGDWLLAARLAALVPSVLITPALFLLGLWLDRRLWTGVLAGLLTALSTPLVTVGVWPVSEPLFLLVAAAVLLSWLAFLRRPGWRLGVFMGVCAGLATACRSEGLYYTVAIALSGGWVAWRGLRRGGAAAPAAPSRRRAVLAVLIFLLVALVLGQGILLGVRSMGSDLPSNYAYLKQIMLSGQIYALDGWPERERVVHTLNDDCTEIARDDWRDISWGEFLRRYGRRQLLAAMVNIKKMLVEGLPEALYPLMILFLPLALGLVAFWRERPLHDTFVVALFIFPGVVLLPFVQYQPRFFFPVTLVALPLVAMGLRRMLAGVRASRPARRRVVAAVVALILAGYVGLGALEVAKLASRPDTDAPYRRACRWIRQRHGEEFDFAVMSRWEAAYAYLRCRKPRLAVDPLDRLVGYCRHTGTRYILLGPKDAYHNRHLAEAFEHADEVDVGAVRLKVVARFGREGSLVRLIEVQPRP
jgi:hypothetical protein